MIFGPIPSYLRDEILACKCNLIHENADAAAMCTQARPFGMDVLLQGLESDGFDTEHGRRSIETWSISERVTVAWWLRQSRDVKSSPTANVPLCVAALPRLRVPPVAAGASIATLVAPSTEATGHTNVEGRVRLSDAFDVIGLDLEATTLDVALEFVLFGDRMIVWDAQPEMLQVRLHGADFIDLRSPITNEPLRVRRGIDISIRARVRTTSRIAVELRGSAVGSPSPVDVGPRGTAVRHKPSSTGQRTKAGRR